MANVRSGQANTDQLKSGYRNEIEVYLEGKDDFLIYKNYWFPHLQGKIAFIPARTAGIKVPGSKGVQKNVIEKRKVIGAKVFGICDRDAVPDIEVALNIDDQEFIKKNHAQNPYIYYTVLLELENYLVDPTRWEIFRIDTKTGGDGERAVDEVTKELWSHCDILIAHAAANLTLQQIEPKGRVGDGFGAQAKSRAEYENELFTKKNFTDQQKEAYYQWVERIEAFDMPSEPQLRRVFAISRRVHGKALVTRFCQTHCIGTPLIFGVARHIPPPVEIVKKLNSWVNA